MWLGGDPKGSQIPTTCSAKAQPGGTERNVRLVRLLNASLVFTLGGVLIGLCCGLENRIPTAWKWKEVIAWKLMTVMGLHPGLSGRDQAVGGEKAITSWELCGGNRVS